MSLVNAILFGTKAQVVQALNAGADVNEIDVYGYPPLIEAAIANKTEIAEILLARGAEIDQADLTGRTALHWAVDNHNFNLSRLLLENGANANAYTIASQPVLVTTLLRQQQDLKRLLYKHGADLNFAQDFINTKLLGHRFELRGQTDIVNSAGRFVPLDYEGFYLEFTIGVIWHSLAHYLNNFAARHLRDHFNYLQLVQQSFAIAAELISYQHYQINIQEHAAVLDSLLSKDLLLLPVAYHGHAITFIRSGNLFAKCDRGANSKKEGSVVIYHMTKPEAMTPNFLKELLYKKQTIEFIESGYKKVLGLVPVLTLPIPSQLTGNCSWANVEASIPTLFFMLSMRFGQEAEPPIERYMKLSLSIYEQWLEWDKNNALYECMESFYRATPARRASKATILAAVLFQSCDPGDPKDIERANKMLPILTLPEYQYILDSYVKAYHKVSGTKAGKRLMQLLEYCDANTYR